MNTSDQRPIGIFDSGIGGLTLARAVADHLPNERIIYFGDTCHLPYGDKSSEAIRGFCDKIVEFLMEFDCKAILIACNSASAAAYDFVRNKLDKKIIVLDVISPVVKFVCENYKSQKIGVIGTRQTIYSNVYQKKINELENSIHVVSLATPLLAPMIEDGFHNSKISESIVAEYLKKEELKGIDALIPGCTHYPLISKEIIKVSEGSFDLISTVEIVSNELASLLVHNNALSTVSGDHRFFVSDLTESFKKSTSLFFGEKLNLSLKKLE